MEVVSADGSAIQVKPGQTRELGRSNGLNSSDNTVSRRHVSFFIPQDTNNEEILLRFEVLGRNPIYVSKDDEVKIFRRFERGEMENGDMFCVSAKNPVWYTLRKIENGGGSVRRNDIESELADNFEGGVGSKCAEDFQQEGVDISDIDPVKEFGFLVIGHEFDSYPTKMISDIKNWDWFLEEARKDSDDDDDDGDDNKGKKRNFSGKRKRKKGTVNEDEEWTGESEDDKVLIDKSKKAQKAKYITRSKDHGKTNKVTSKSKSPNFGSKSRNREVDDEDEEDDDEDVDETLGGFIVGDENLEDEEEIEDDDEDEEEEFADEDEDE